MKKFVLMMLVICFLFTGCSGVTGKSETASTEPAAPTQAADSAIATTSPSTQEATEAVNTIYPLPDTTMENLRDAILPISLNEDGVYADETGKLHMEIAIYGYDQYDMVDISMLKVGDTIVTHAGEVKVTSLETKNGGTISINGGLFENGFDLVTDDSGIYYECGYNDAKNWYQIGEAILSIAADFVCHDNSDLEVQDRQYSAGNFMNGEIMYFDFTPYNTTIRVENGQIVEMYREYTP